MYAVQVFGCVYLFVWHGWIRVGTCIVPPCRSHSRLRSLEDPTMVSFLSIRPANTVSSLGCELSVEIFDSATIFEYEDAETKVVNFIFRCLEGLLGTLEWELTFL